MRLTERSPGGVSIYDPASGQWVATPWQVDLHVGEGGTETVLFYVLTPESAGAFSLNTEVGYLEEGNYLFYEDVNRSFVVE